MATKASIRHSSRVPRATITTWDPDRLRAVLRDRGWTISQLSIALDSSRPVVSNYFYGGAPSPKVLVQLAEVLGVDTTELAPMSATPTLHELRWHAGMTIAEMAAKIGLSVGRVSMQMRAEDKITHTERWCEALSVSPETLSAAWVNTRKQKMPS